MVVARNLIKDAANFSYLNDYIPTETYNTYDAVPEEQLVKGSKEGAGAGTGGS
jgi:hypothetical protein